MNNDSKVPMRESNVMVARVLIGRTLRPRVRQFKLQLTSADLSRTL